jgi:predicted N-acetyltransferase YhbS
MKRFDADVDTANFGIRQCTPSDMLEVIASIDREFIFNKGRSLSMSRRYPNVMARHNIEHILVAGTRRSICGALGIRAFDYADEHRIWHGAMIGMVWVDPRYRGKGLGRALMGEAERVLKEERLDFGVLWTGIPAFYEPTGWYLKDSSLFGEARACSPSLNTGPAVPSPLGPEDAARLEKVRSTLECRRVIRKPSDYRVIPPPAVDVLCFWASGAEGEGYALAGEADGEGYLYEMVAPPGLWDGIWSGLMGRFKRLWVNGRVGDPFARWLADRSYAFLQPQNKTMWYRISRVTSPAPWETWHIPYFDRI